jgi:tetraacyldisaccharide 4'-kinase
MPQTRDAIITKAWYEGALWLYLLWPLSLIYQAVIIIRGFFYRSGVFKVHHVGVPVVVVGNITVGGTGKSPLVCHLIESLRNKGFNPGIVSRGYGAKIGKYQVREVFAHSLATEVGDEPLMLKKKLACRVFVSPSRDLAAKALEKEGCDIIISDDGMQHYALHRDIEICVFDGQRKWGNGHLLPMGPLREPISRLQSIPYLVVNGASNSGSYGQASLKQKAFSMSLQAESLISMNNENTKVLQEFSGKTVHAVAAIGHPDRFFNTLSAAGINLEKHAFGDHHAYQKSDFMFDRDLPIIMTEKDAVKCELFDLKQSWYLPVTAKLNGDLAAQIIEDVGLS